MATRIYRLRSLGRLLVGSNAIVHSGLMGDPSDSSFGGVDGWGPGDCMIWTSQALRRTYGMSVPQCATKTNGRAELVASV